MQDDIVIGLDADDTLWENELMFFEAEARLREILAPWAPGDQVDEAMIANERRTINIYGFGVKGFVLSMIETAVEISRGQIDAAQIGEIIMLGQSILKAPVALFPGVAETVAALARLHPLLLITKGDTLHQRRKIDESGLREYLIGAEVVDEKDPATYRTLLARYSVDPRQFVMVGNSLRSDIDPIVEIGGRAVHIPHHVTSHLEQATVHPPSRARPKVLVLGRFTELPNSLADFVQSAAGPKEQ